MTKPKTLEQFFESSKFLRCIPNKEYDRLLESTLEYIESAAKLLNSELPLGFCRGSYNRALTDLLAKLRGIDA